ncbi:MAG: hypothetical protein M3Q07_06850 [Pseudobdellovibrionaceae bacterium]|nr:hypothetical protein [Pseudobdellovibrionaceae bacterium]
MNPNPSPDFTTEARSLGYFPFILFSPLEYLTFKELYGEWIFDGSVANIFEAVVRL